MRRDQVRGLAHTHGTTEGATVTTSESTTSTSYTDLTTSGPSVTMTPPASGKVKVSIYAGISNSGASVSTMSFELSGGNTLAAADARAIGDSGTVVQRMGATFLLTGLAAASTTFTTKYKTGGAVNPAVFENRQIIVESVEA